MVFCQLFYAVTTGSFLRPRHFVGGQYYHYWPKYSPPLTLHTGDGSDFHYLNREFDESAGETRLAGILLDENPYSFC